MSLNLSDAAIMQAYNDVASSSANDFMILDYLGSRDTLHVASTSSGGLEAMKVHLSKPSQDARFGLLNVENRLLLWSFLPTDSLSGVKRARSLVHQRTLASALKHYASLSVSNVDTFSHAIVRSKLRLDGGSGSLPPSPNIQQSHFSSRPVSPNPPLQAKTSQSDLRPPALPTKDLRTSTSSAKSSPTHLSPRSDHSFTHQQAQQQRASDLGRESPIFSTMTTSHSDEDDEPIRPNQNGLSISNLPQPLPSPIAMPNSYMQTAPSSHMPLSAVPNTATQSSAVSNIAIRHEPAPTPPIHTEQTQDDSLTRTTSESEDIKRLYQSTHADSTQSPQSYFGHEQNHLAQSQNQSGQGQLGVAYNQDQTQLGQGQNQLGQGQPERSRTVSANSTSSSSGRPGPTRITPPSITPPSRELENAHINDGGQGQQTSEYTSSAIQQTTAQERFSHRPENPSLSNQEEYRKQDLQQPNYPASPASQQDFSGQIQSPPAVSQRAYDPTHQSPRPSFSPSQPTSPRQSHEQASMNQPVSPRSKDEQVEEAERQEAAERMRLEADRIAQVEREAAIRAEEEETSRIAEERRVEEERQRVAEEEQRKAELDRRLKAEEAERVKDQARKREELTTRIKGKKDAGQVMLEGWVNAQGANSIMWRRRYFKLHPTRLDLYKSQTDLDKAIQVVDLNSYTRLADGIEDESSLPHSFTLSFKDDESRFFYCDSEEDKEILTSALRMICA